MTDKIQITLFVERNGSTFVISGSLSEENDAFVYVTTTCPPDCDFVTEDCRNCKYRDVEIEGQLLDEFEERVIESVKKTKEIMGF